MLQYLIESCVNLIKLFGYLFNSPVLLNTWLILKKYIENNKYIFE